MNLIFCGSSGTGKSAAIKTALREASEPIYGFWTEKLTPTVTGECPVVLHGCTERLNFTHLIGICKERHAERFPSVFDEFGVKFLSDIPKGSLVLMDEIGFMENDAKDFLRAVFAVLDGDYRVIAAVRDRSTPLLDAIRSHEKSFCVQAIEARDAETLQSILMRWNFGHGSAK